MTKEKKNAVLNKGSHSKLDLEFHCTLLRNDEILNQVQDDNYFKEEALNLPVRRALRAPLRSGFTLIELLVVVLIIGILAAIALPQYQKAVDRTRMMEGIMSVQKIAQAQELYKLINGVYTRDITALDLEWANDTKYGSLAGKQTKHFILAASNEVGEQRDIAVAQSIPYGARYGLIITTTGTRVCVQYRQISAYEKQLCKAWADGKL